MSRMCGNAEPFCEYRGDSGVCEKGCYKCPECGCRVVTGGYSPMGAAPTDLRCITCRRKADGGKLVWHRDGAHLEEGKHDD